MTIFKAAAGEINPDHLICLENLNLLDVNKKDVQSLLWTLDS